MAEGASLWQKGRLTDLGTLGGKDATALDINERGQIVGYSSIPTSTASTLRHAFVWQNGRMTDLGTLTGGTNSRALAINDRGQVVGFAVNRTRQIHAVLWTFRSG